MNASKGIVWFTAASISVLFSIAFTIMLFPDPLPVDEQLAEYRIIVDSDDRWNEGIQNHHQGDYVVAMNLYNQAIQIHPESKMAFLYRGTLHYDQGQYEEAINDYTQALNIDSQFTWALNARGVALFRNGQPDSAQKDFAYSQEIDPTFMGPNINEAVIQKLKGNLDQALMILNKAEGFFLPTKPTREVLENIVDIFHSQGNMQQALTICTQLIENYPEHAIAYKLRAQLYRALGNEEQAKADEQHYHVASQGEIY